jgi:hypothetical protein
MKRKDGLIPDKGDGHWVMILFDAVLADWKAGGHGLTEEELIEYGRLRFNMSGTIERLTEQGRWDGMGRENGPSSLPIPSAMDRADPRWRTAAQMAATQAIARATRNFTVSSFGARARPALFTKANRRSNGGVVPKGAPPVRYTVNLRDNGRPVLPRIWFQANPIPSEFRDYDPDLGQSKVNDHMAVVAWLTEARVELARAKKRPAELHALVERAISIISVTGD